MFDAFLLRTGAYRPGRIRGGQGKRARVLPRRRLHALRGALPHGLCLSPVIAAAYCAYLVTFRQGRGTSASMGSAPDMVCAFLPAVLRFLAISASPNT